MFLKDIYRNLLNVPDYEISEKSHVYYDFDRPSLENRQNLFGVPLKFALCSLYSS